MWLKRAIFQNGFWRGCTFVFTQEISNQWQNHRRGGKKIRLFFSRIHRGQNSSVVFIPKLLFVLKIYLYSRKKGGQLIDVNFWRMCVYFKFRPSLYSKKNPQNISGMLLVAWWAEISWEYFFFKPWSRAQTSVWSSLLSQDNFCLLIVSLFHFTSSPVKEKFLSAVDYFNIIIESFSSM